VFFRRGRTVVPGVAGVSDRRVTAAASTGPAGSSPVSLKSGPALADRARAGMLGMVPECRAMTTVQDFSNLSLFQLTLPPCLTVWPYHEVVLTGHRIGLYTILRHLHEGRSPAEIPTDYPTLEPELVEQVLTFIREHPAETEEYRAAYKAELDRQYEEWKNSPMAKRGPTREELQRRLAERGITIRVELGPEFDKPFAGDTP
jgi:uncharacterized protein (DUF433 family)